MFNTNKIFLLLILYELISNFYILPFETVYLKDQSNNKDDYHNILFQNELYTNLSIGTPPQTVPSLLKMDLNGFSLYQGAFNYNLSSTSQKGIWDLNVNYLWYYLAYPIKDYFYFNSFTSYDDFNIYAKSLNKITDLTNLYNITKTSKISFLVMEKPPNYSNKKYYYYGIIGLRLNEKYYRDAPEFILTFKNSKDIISYEFSYIFNKDNYTYKNYFNNFNKGYFIFNEEFNENIIYTNAQMNQKGLSWFIYFDRIYTNLNEKKKKKSKNFKVFKATKLAAEFIFNFPYIIGTEQYLHYINKTFFNDLISKKLCTYNLIDNKRTLYGFICEGNSKNFINNLNNFPDLIFEHTEFEENFILKKNDLFAYNNFNVSDTNMYFLIMFGINDYYNWTLGIPFLKKYKLSFNYDKKKIGYLKNNDEIYFDNDEKKSYVIIIKILIIVFLIVIIFILGMLYQEKIIKIPRKTKANELDDNYEYNNYEKKIINDINDVKNNKNKKEVELGLKLLK